MVLSQKPCPPPLQSSRPRRIHRILTIPVSAYFSEITGALRPTPHIRPQIPLRAGPKPGLEHPLVILILETLGNIVDLGPPLPKALGVTGALGVFALLLAVDELGAVLSLQLPPLVGGPLPEDAGPGEVPVEAADLPGPAQRRGNRGDHPVLFVDAGVAVDVLQELVHVGDEHVAHAVPVPGEVYRRYAEKDAGPVEVCQGDLGAGANLGRVLLVRVGFFRNGEAAKAAGAVETKLFIKVILEGAGHGVDSVVVDGDLLTLRDLADGVEGVALGDLVPGLVGVGLAVVVDARRNGEDPDSLNIGFLTGAAREVIDSVLDGFLDGLLVGVLIGEVVISRERGLQLEPVGPDDAQVPRVAKIAIGVVELEKLLLLVEGEGLDAMDDDVRKRAGATDVDSLVGAAKIEKGLLVEDAGALVDVASGDKTLSLVGNVLNREHFGD